MTPVKLVLVEASPRLRPALAGPQLTTQVLQPKLATDVHTPSMKLTAKAEAV